MDHLPSRLPFRSSAANAEAADGELPVARSPTTMMQELSPTISIEQAGEMLGISRRSAYRAAATGELPTLRLGRRLLVPTARLLELLGLPTDGVRQLSKPA